MSACQRIVGKGYVGEVKQERWQPGRNFPRCVYGIRTCLPLGYIYLGISFPEFCFPHSC